jgi:hypothetical protein
VEQIGTQAYSLKFSQQANNIQDVFHISLLKPYVSNRCAAPKHLLPYKIDHEEEYGLEKILQSEYRYGTLHYRVKYKGYSADQSKWQPVDNLAHMQDMVSKFYELYPNQVSQWAGGRKVVLMQDAKMPMLLGSM